MSPRYHLRQISLSNMSYVFYLLILSIIVVTADPSKFEVHNSQDNPCIIATMSVDFVVPYTISSGGTVNATLKMPSSASSNNSVCTSNKVMLLLSWGEGVKVEFDFSKEDKDEWAVDHVHFTYNLNDSSVFLNSTDTGLQTVTLSELLFKTKMDVAYLCQKETIYTFNNSQVLMRLGDLKLQAFKFSGKDYSSEVNDCSKAGGGSKEPEKKDITVPIAVGATLGVLIVILIIAYFVGKRSSREYQSI